MTTRINMENETKINELERKIEELTRRLDSLNSNTTIPYQVGEAFKDRLGVVSGDSNATSASTHTQAVNEGGLASYSVAKPMAGFITIVVNGNSRAVPYY